MTLSSSNSSDSGFEVHEVIFAESLGVNLQEEFALELLEVASKALYVLPEGWEVGLAESELGTIPFFYDTNSDQSHWVHPYAQDLKMLVEEKRLELLRGEDVFNEEDEIEDDSDFFVDTEDVSNVRVNTDISEINALPSRIKSSMDEPSAVFEENMEMEMDISTQNKDLQSATNTNQIETDTATEPIDNISSNEKDITPGPSIVLEKQEKEIKEPPKNADDTEETSPLAEEENVNPDTASSGIDIVSDASLESTQPEKLIVEEVKESEITSNTNLSDQSDDGIGLAVLNDMTGKENFKSTGATVESTEKAIPTAFAFSPKETSFAILIPEKIPVETISDKKELSGERKHDNDELDQTAKETEKQQEINEIVLVSEILEQLSAPNNETEVVIPDKEILSNNMQDVVEENHAIELLVKGATINIEAADSASLIADTPLNSLEGGISLADIEEDISSLASNSSSVLAIVIANDVVPIKVTPEKENRSSPMQLENKDMTPPKGIPLPTDPFADFFVIDPSFHQFIDNLEKKQRQKKKKLLTKAGRSPIRNNASASADDENNESLDLDEIIRKRRQTERAQELERARIQKEKEEIEEIRRKQQKVMEEEKEKQTLLRKEIEAAKKVEKEKAEQATKQAKEKAEQDKKAAEEAEARRKLEAEEIISVPTVPAHSPPFSKTRSMDLGDTTRSLFDDLVAQESIPDNDDVLHHSVHFHPTLSFTQKLEAAQTPVTPLDKSMDVMDHFRNIYSAPTADQQHHHITHNHSHAREMHTPDVSPTKKGKFLDTTKLVSKDTSKRSKKKYQTTSDLPPSSLPTTTNNLLNSTSAPKLKPHATSVDGWVTLAAYTNYKEAERAVVLFEALAPTKSIAGQSFPSHSKFLPPVKGLKVNNSPVMDESYASTTSPLKKKSLLLSNAPITKESILLSTQQELPQVRIARDLGRMQWIVECNDVNMKKVFERRIARRLHQGQGAEKLLAHLSPAKEQALGLGEEDKEEVHHGTKKSKHHNKSQISPLKHIGEKFTAPFVPQALISSKNTKHVSGQMHVHYALPRVSYDEQQKTKSFQGKNSNSMSNNNRSNSATLKDGAKTHRGPLTFRAVTTLNASPQRNPRPSSTHV